MCKIIQLMPRGEPGSLALLEVDILGACLSDPLAGKRIVTEIHGLQALFVRLELSYRAGQMHEVCDFALVAAGSARGLGLERVAQIAQTVAALARRPDATALAAVMARLCRLGAATELMVTTQGRHG